MAFVDVLIFITAFGAGIASGSMWCGAMRRRLPQRVPRPRNVAD